MKPPLVPVPPDDLETLLEMASRYLLCAAERVAPQPPRDMNERAGTIARVRALLDAK